MTEPKNDPCLSESDRYTKFEPKRFYTESVCVCVFCLFVCLSVTDIGVWVSKYIHFNCFVLVKCIFICLNVCLFASIDSQTMRPIVKLISLIQKLNTSRVILFLLPTRKELSNTLMILHPQLSIDIAA